LEHGNETTLGAPSKDLAKDISSYYLDIAHEYFHAWNLVRIKPKGYGQVGYHKAPTSKELWWSEGATMYYADLLVRRAGLMNDSLSREKHLKEMLENYYSLPGNYKLSPEMVSLSEYGNRLLLGNYAASTHNQGEVLATLLDILIRSKTQGKKRLDDVFVKMNEQYAGTGGFTADDIERLVHETCGCDVHTFFMDHIKGDKTLPVARYLSLLGLDMKLDWEKVRTGNNGLAPDLRIYPYMDGAAVRIAISDPESSWSKAGLKTGDQVLGINGQRITSTREFFNLLRILQAGGNVSFEIVSSPGTTIKKIPVTGYKRPVVSIRHSSTTPGAVKLLREQWIKGR
jgi:predicted metalloprotease with PDZ domain